MKNDKIDKNEQKNEQKMINQNLSSNKKIAIIILAFNDERIARAINSVITQTIKPNEIIVIDNSSIDEVVISLRASITSPTAGASVNVNVVPLTA